MGSYARHFISLIMLTWLMTSAAFVLSPLSLYAKNSPEDAELSIALLPILDSLPYYVAESEGYFKDMHIKVKAIPVGSAVERDQMMQSGAVDGMLNEITSTASFNRTEVTTKIVRVARKAYPDSPMFRILASPGIKVKSASDLAGLPIGVSKNTIIEYLTDRILEKEGLKPEQVVKQSTPSIPERYQLLMMGSIKAATLPDPLAKSAVVAGAQVVVDDSKYPLYAVSVLTFSTKAISRKRGLIRDFIKAWDKAAEAVNTRPENYRTLLLERVRLPKNIQASYAMPRYPGNEVPQRAQWDDVMKWMLDKGLLERSLPYDGSVTTEFISPGK